MTETKTRAALFRGAGHPQELAEVTLGPLGPGDVIVEMRAVGICGSDLHMIDGSWVRAQPMVLGHEGAGVVTAAGPEVTGLAVGDHVVLCWAAPCGECVSCTQGAPQRCVPARAAITEGTLMDGTTRISLDGETVYRMTTTGAFADAVLVPAAAAMPIPAEVPFEQAALLGCAAITGAGAALNAGQIDATTDTVVIGAGGVGQFAIQGARIAGAPRIVAVDPSPQRRELALALGATAAVAPDELAAQEPFARAIDAVGVQATTAAAVAAVHPGGRVVVVGLPAGGAKLELDPTELVVREKTITGSFYGSANPVESLARLLELVADGSLALEPLLGPSYPLAQIDAAVREAQSAAGGRVIVLPGLTYVAAGDAKVLELAGREVRITSPGKVLFPERGETKLDLVRYYAAVGDPLMRTMGGRPVLMQRFPQGASGKSFFQKRVPDGAPEWLETTTVQTVNGTPSRALVAADVAHVAWAVNLACLGFHVWPALASDPEHADELRLDLDPQPGTGFPEAVAAAWELKALLDELGLTGYPKTTGNRGLHVYLRLEPRWDSYEVRSAAVAVARELERRRPDILTAAWWKEERGERIFIDYNQNAPHKTVFGAWSVRARVGAQVSTPLRWEELDDVDPAELTMATVPARLERDGDPWIDMAPQSLEPLLELHERDMANGLMDAPWPPVYPKMPNEPPRVAPSRARKED